MESWFWHEGWRYLWFQWCNLNCWRIWSRVSWRGEVSGLSDVVASCFKSICFFPLLLWKGVVPVKRSVWFHSCTPSKHAFSYCRLWIRLLPPAESSQFFYIVWSRCFFFLSLVAVFFAATRLLQPLFHHLERGSFEHLCNVLPPAALCVLLLSQLISFSTPAWQELLRSSVLHTVWARMLFQT